MYSPLKPRGNSLPHHLNDGPLRHPFKSWHGAGQEENVTLDLASTKRIKVLLRFSISLFASSVSWCQETESRSTNLPDSQLYKCALTPLTLHSAYQVLLLSFVSLPVKISWELSYYLPSHNPVCPTHPSCKSVASFLSCVCFRACFEAALANDVGVIRCPWVTFQIPVVLALTLPILTFNNTCSISLCCMALWSFILQGFFPLCTPWIVFYFSPMYFYFKWAICKFL